MKHTKSIRSFDENGNIEYRNKAGKLHRLNGPASITLNGHQAWYKNGIMFRDNNLPSQLVATGDHNWTMKDGCLLEMSVERRTGGGGPPYRFNFQNKRTIIS